MDLISVIVPGYNVEKYLDRCMNSIVNQTYKNIEIIVVDDGSTDSSGKICDYYEQSDDRFKVIHKKNEGLGYARNTGLENSSGKYVVFVDSDDYIEKDMIQNLYDDLISKHADTCIGGFKRIYSDKIIRFMNPFSGKCFSGNSIIDSVLVKMFGKERNPSDYLEMSVWKILFSNEIIREHNIFFPSERELISEDIIFDLDYYKYATKVYMSKTIGYCYCANDGSLTTKYRSNRFDLQVKLFEELEKKTNKMGIYDISLQRRLSSFIGNVRYCIKLEEKFSSLNGINVAKNNIKEICNNNTLIKAMSLYNKKNDRFFSRLVDELIKYKMVNSLILVMHLKNKMGI